jgi:hypothetical protein
MTERPASLTPCQPEAQPRPTRPFGQPPFLAFWRAAIVFRADVTDPPSRPSATRHEAATSD